LTPAEVDAYRKAKSARWFREGPEANEGTERDPFETVPGHEGVFRIRKREDGACGFLSTENRCRIHEELGGDRKPLTCRLFPFDLHAVGREVVLTTSFSCPTVAAGSGATLESQATSLNALQREWSRRSAEREVPLLFSEDKAIDASTAAEFRSILRKILERRNADGVRDLRENVARMALYCDDLTRHRVLRLPADAFSEYLTLTGRYTATTDKPLAPHAPTRLSRLFFRGFLFAVIALRLRLEEKQTTGMRLGLRWRLLRAMAHLHGLGPALGDINFNAIRNVRVPDDDPAIAAILYNFLRSTIECLGTGRRPLIEELGFSVAQLHVACAIAAMQAGHRGMGQVSPEELIRGLTKAADLSRAQMNTGPIAAPGPLYLFAERN
jgi:Fe-S-cluster containining protein